MELFTANDFKIFAIAGFQDRMTAIAARVRPKLTDIGQGLQPRLSALVDQPMYLHVAKHARRTVNPPDDTWAAFCLNPRGYKKHVHFKFAISRNCVRLLCEVGPEYAAKSEWLMSWNRNFKEIARGLQSSSNLGWYEDEHDEDPTAVLKDLRPSELKGLPEMLTRKRDGQFVLGRRIPAREFAKLKASEVETLAFDTYKALARMFF